MEAESPPLFLRPITRLRMEQNLCSGNLPERPKTTESGSELLKGKLETWGWKESTGKQSISNVEFQLSSNCEVKMVLF